MCRYSINVNWPQTDLHPWANRWRTKGLGGLGVLQGPAFAYEPFSGGRGRSALVATSAIEEATRGARFYNGGALVDRVLQVPVISPTSARRRKTISWRSSRRGHCRRCS